MTRPPHGTPAWLEHLVKLLDDGFRVPGTSFRFGLDGILGLLLPGAGDALGAASAGSLFWLAIRRGAPRAVLARMALNVAIDALLGALPILGDAFDLGFKANRRNLVLIERVAADEAAGRPAHTLGDKLFIGLVLVLLGAVLLLPALAAALVLRALLAQ